MTAGAALGSLEIRIPAKNGQVELASGTAGLDSELLHQSPARLLKRVERLRVAPTDTAQASTDRRMLAASGC